MYRDDDEAARALADKLLRENAALEDERAELTSERSELAGDNAALRRENERLKAQLAADDEPGIASPSDTRVIGDRALDAADRKTASARRRRRGRRGARERANQSGELFVRLIAAVIAGVGGALVTSLVYPVLHGKTAVFPTILSALVNQLWGQVLLAQALLGWMPDEEKRKRSTPGWRIATLVIGLLAIASMAAFIAFVGESSMGT